MLELPETEVMIDMGKTGTAENAFCYKHVQSDSKRQPYGVELLNWNDFMNRLREFYPKYCTICQVLYRNSTLYDINICKEEFESQEHAVWEAVQFYYEYGKEDSNSDNMPMQEINDDFWQWKPQGEDVLLDDIKDFYANYHAFCKFFDTFINNYFQSGLSADTLDDKVSVETDGVPIEYDEQVFNQSDMNKLSGEGIVPEWLLPEQLDFLRESVCAHPIEFIKGYDIVKDAAILFRGQLDLFFEKYRMNTGSMAAADFIEFNSWKFRSYSSMVHCPTQVKDVLNGGTGEKNYGKECVRMEAKKTLKIIFGQGKMIIAPIILKKDPTEKTGLMTCS